MKLTHAQWSQCRDVIRDHKETIEQKGMSYTELARFIRQTADIECSPASMKDMLVSLGDDAPTIVPGGTPKASKNVQIKSLQAQGSRLRACIWYLASLHKDEKAAKRVSRILTGTQYLDGDEDNGNGADE